MKKFNNKLQLGLAAGLMFGVLPNAHAVGVTAGTDISNTVTVNYQVNSTAQDPETADVTFKVDRKIVLTVVSDGNTSVLPGATGQVLAFTVTNDANSPLDFALSVAQDAGDEFDVTAYTIYADRPASAGGTSVGTFDVDDVAWNRQYIDELAADASSKVFVVSTIPNAGNSDGDQAGIVLTAEAHLNTGAGGIYAATADALGAAAVETVGADTTNIDNVFGDVAGETDNEGEADHSAIGYYTLETASIQVGKYSTVISDPFNSTTNPKAIPGATVEYCLIVRNTGAAAASAIVLTDEIPANTEYVAGTIRTAVAGDNVSCTSGTGGAEDDVVGAPDATDPHSGSFDAGAGANGTVTIGTPSLPATTGVFRATFRVTINN